MHDRLPGGFAALPGAVGDHFPVEPKALPKKRGRPPKAAVKTRAKPTPKAKCKGKAKAKACPSKSKTTKPKAVAKAKARKLYCFLGFRVGRYYVDVHIHPMHPEVRCNEEIGKDKIIIYNTYYHLVQVPWDGDREIKI